MQQITSRYDLDELVHVPPTPSPSTTSAARACAWRPICRSSLPRQPRRRLVPGHPSRRRRDARRRHRPAPESPQARIPPRRTERRRLDRRAHREHHPRRDDDQLWGLRACMLAACTADGARRPAGDDVDRDSGSGYFANVTHAPALIGLAGGLLRSRPRGRRADHADLQRRSGGDRSALRRGDRRDVHRPEPVDQLLHPVRRRIGAHRRRRHDRRRRARRPRGHRQPDDLEGTTLATPQLGNTQDVALRSWLADEGFETDTTAAGTCTSRPPRTPRR